MRKEDDPVRKLIRQQLAVHHLDMAEVSRAVGRNHAYLQQYLERGVPAQVPEEIREPLAKILVVHPEQLIGQPRSRSRRHSGSLATIPEPVAPQHTQPGIAMPDAIPATERAHLKMIIDALARRDPETVAFIAADMEVMAEASLRNHKLTAFERGGWISQTARTNEQGGSKAGAGDGQSTARKNPAR